LDDIRGEPQKLTKEESQTATALNELLGIRIHGLIQCGGQGTIYHGVDGNNAEFAVKITSRPQRPYRELSGLGLPEHPNIATIFHLLLYDPNHEKYLTVSKKQACLMRRSDRFHLKAVVSQLVVGWDLAEILMHPTTPGPKLAMIIVSQLVQALKHCHAHNVLHRDMKPENILFTPTGEVKLVDFGLAGRLPENGRRYSLLGSPFFLSPEVVNDANHRDDRYGHSFPLDAWGLGLVLWMTLTGTSLARLFSQDGDEKPEAKDFFASKCCTCSTRFARMSDEQKITRLFKFIRTEAKKESGLATLVELIIGLTKESPAERLTLADAEKVLGQEPLSRTNLHEAISALPLPHLAAAVSPGSVSLG